MHFDSSGKIADHRLRVTKQSPSRFRKILVPLLSALAVLAAVAPVIAQKSAKKNHTPHYAGIDLARRRADWFYRQRAYPAGKIPAGAREAALKALHAMREKSAVANPNISSLAWQSIGPAPTSQTPFGNTSGRVTALAVDPTDSTGKTVYLGSADGGVWKTTDLQNWTPLTDDQPTLSIGSLALDASTNPPTIYAGTGEENFARDSYYGAGFLKSTNGGQTWTSSGVGVFGGAPAPLNSTTGGPFIGALSVDPNASLHQVVLAAVKGGDPSIPSGIWRSTNGGTSWASVLSPSLKVEATDVVFDPNDAAGMTAYAALGHPGGDSDTGAPCKSSAPCNGVFISTNAGASWTRLTGLDQASDQTQFGRITLGVGPQVSGKTVMYAAVANADDSSSTFFGLFKSLDGGATWSQLTAPPNNLCDPSCFYDMAIRVSPTNASLIFAGGSDGGGNGSTMYRSVDGGSSWQDVTIDKSGTAIHSDQHALGFSADGSELFAGNDGGIWSSADVTNTSIAAGSQTWTNLNTGSTSSGLSITQFFPGLTVHPSSDTVAFGGTQGNSAQLYNTNAWIAMGVAQCDGGFTAIDAAIPTTVFTTCGDLQQPASVVPFLFRSLSGGFVNDFVVAENGINTADPASYLPPIAGDASRSQTFYLATNRLYQTIDNGNTWTAISTDLTGSVGNFLTALAIAPSDSNTVYVGSIDGIVQVSHNALSGSVGFARVIAGLPDRSVTSLAIDASDPTLAYVAFSGFSGFNGDSLGHVFMTTNGGGQWNDISANLPNIPVNAIVADPNISGTLYAGTDIGVFITSDSGASWQPLGTGLPNAVVMSLNLRSASRVLTAVTHGRGAWDIALGGLPAMQLTDISPVQSNTAPPISITATGVGFTSQSVIQISGTPVTPTTLNSDGSLSASIPASALQNSSGVYGITVATGQRVSNSLPFTTSNPAPTITTISPTSGIIGDGTVILTVTGTGFLPNAVINFGNTSLTPGTGGSSTSLVATIPTSALATAAAVNVTVTNPAPGGGTSNAVVFDIQDYAYGPVSPPVATIKAGATADFTIPVIGLFGFSTEITLTCGTGLPADATCTFNPTNITPTASGASQQLAITTVANRSSLPPGNPAHRWPPLARGIWLAVAALLTVWFALRIRPRKRSSGMFGVPLRRAALAISLAGLMFGAALAGCGGGSSTGTPVGTYQITITANGNADGTETATHTTTVTMIVQ